MFTKDEITVKIKEYLFPGVEFRLIDPVLMPLFTIDNMDEIILAIFPNVTDYVIMIGETEDMDSEEVYEEYFLKGFLRMIARIKQEKVEWYEENNPELLKTLRNIERL